MAALEMNVRSGRGCRNFAAENTRILAKVQGGSSSFGAPCLYSMMFYVEKHSGHNII